MYVSSLHPPNIAWFPPPQRFQIFLLPWPDPVDTFTCIRHKPVASRYIYNFFVRLLNYSCRKLEISICWLIYKFSIFYPSFTLYVTSRIPTCEPPLTVKYNSYVSRCKPITYYARKYWTRILELRKLFYDIIFFII